MGGWVAQWLLHEAPDLADRAILISPAGAGTWGSLDAIGLMTPHTPHDVLHLWDRQWYRRPAVAEFMARDVLARFHAPEVRGFLMNLTTEDILVDDHLADIRAPLLVIWGMNDGILDVETPAYLAERWGGPVERTYLARCGHLPHIERGEAVVERIRGFVGAS
jgi:pimeloyl-ACP methyl ester carboxylesterase